MCTLWSTASLPSAYPLQICAFIAYLSKQDFFAGLSERLKKKNAFLSIFVPLQQFYVHQICTTFAPAKLKTAKTSQFANILIFYIILF